MCEIGYNISVIQYLKKCSQRVCTIYSFLVHTFLVLGLPMLKTISPIILFYLKNYSEVRGNFETISYQADVQDFKKLAKWPYIYICPSIFILKYRFSTFAHLIIKCPKPSFTVTTPKTISKKWENLTTWVPRLLPEDQNMYRAF